MASTDWLCLAGVEVVNNARTLAYARAGLAPGTMSVRDCVCADLHLMLGDAQPYRRPDLDAVPPSWVDPAEPDSYDFAGLYVTDIKGLDAAPVDRTVTNRLGDGVIIGRRRYGPRVITVTGLLMGGTCCATDYGMRWLSSALAGSLGCGPGSCGGDDLRYLTCCPTICEDSPDFVSYEACATPYLRTLRDVVLTQEPQVISQIGGGCSCCSSCPALEVQFQLTAGMPRALREPVTVVSGAIWDPDDPDTECVEWSTDPACVDEATACAQRQAVPCPLDPACPPPELPQLPLPDNPCQCEPLAGRSRLCVDIPAGTAPIWADAVPVLTIYAGSTALRSIRIRFYPNPLGRPVDDLDPCGFCAELNISFIPAYGTLTLDGTRRQALVQCPGRADTPAGSVLAGPQGAPLIWPELECGIGYTVCVEVDAATLNPDATVSLSTVVREV